MKKDDVRMNLLQDVGEYVNDAAINTFVKWLQAAGLPEVKAFAAEYLHALNEHGEEESGWCKFRDRFFLPAVINSALWLFETTLNRVAEETKVNANA